MIYLESSIAVQFKNVEYEIERSLILKGVTGDIYKGKLTSIIGPSGAGKSTLLSLINLLKSSTSGEILIDQQSIQTYNQWNLEEKYNWFLKKQR